MTSAQGEDRSAFQAIYPWTGLAFGFCKATNGLSVVDPNFGPNWSNLAHAGIPRGAYHELTNGASPQAQAMFFVAVVKERGLNAGDMLAIVASDYPVSAAAVRAALDETARLAGPHCPVLCYSDLSTAANLTSCGDYPLWAAHPDLDAPGPVGPWKTWHLWQWGDPGGVDHDAFNGTVAGLRAWIASYLPTPLPPPSTGGDQDMLVDRQLTEGQPAQASWPAGNVKSVIVVNGSPTPATVAYRWRHADGWYPALNAPALGLTAPAGGLAGLITTPGQNMDDVDAVQVTGTGAAMLSMHSIDG